VWQNARGSIYGLGDLSATDFFTVGRFLAAMADANFRFTDIISILMLRNANLSVY
jgi:hypothetical protein